MIDSDNTISLLFVTQPGSLKRPSGSRGIVVTDSDRARLAIWSAVRQLQADDVLLPICRVDRVVFDAIHQRAQAIR